MKQKKFFIFILLFLGAFLYASEIPADEQKSEVQKPLEEELLSMQVTGTFDARFDSPAKKFYFYKGATPITEKEFEALVDDPALTENREKMHKAKITGFSTTGILGGLTICFMIPSLVFIITQANNHSWASKGYNTWLDFYNSEYSYVFLPGLIAIILTGVFTISTIFALAFTFYAMHKYQNNEALYQAVIKRYNLNLQKKYQIQPDLGLGVNGSRDEALEMSLKMKF